MNGEFSNSFKKWGHWILAETPPLLVDFNPSKTFLDFPYGIPKLLEPPQNNLN